MFACVRTEKMPLELSFANLKKDQGDHAWDLVLIGSWRVADSRGFLERFALDMVSPDVSLSRQVADSWLAKTIGPDVRDAVGDQDLEDLRKNDALPLR